MTLPKADLTFSEIRNPTILWCKTGHEVPPGTKMYTASGVVLPKAGWGDYCQYCVDLVHQIKAAQQKTKDEAKRIEEEPEQLSLEQLKHRLRGLGFVGGIAEKEESEEIPIWEKFITNCR